MSPLSKRVVFGYMVPTAMTNPLPKLFWGKIVEEFPCYILHGFQLSAVNLQDIPSPKSTEHLQSLGREVPTWTQ